MIVVKHAVASTCQSLLRQSSQLAAAYRWWLYLYLLHGAVSCCCTCANSLLCMYGSANPNLCNHSLLRFLGYQAYGRCSFSSKFNICFCSFTGASNTRIDGMSVISVSYFTCLAHKVSDLGTLGYHGYNRTAGDSR